MKPDVHARNAVKKFGGQESDYIDIMSFFDWSKSSHADIRHRAIFHNALGAFVCERIFGYPYKEIQEAANKYGWTEEEVEKVQELVVLARTDKTTYIRNSDNQRVSVRDVAEQHILEDLGWIPSLTDYLKYMQIALWMSGPIKKTIMIIDKEENEQKI